MMISSRNQGRTPDTSHCVGGGSDEVVKLPDANLADVGAAKAGQGNAGLVVVLPRRGKSGARGTIEKQIQSAIGSQLRSLFSDITSEAVPQRFLDLIETLESKDGQASR